MRLLLFCCAEACGGAGLAVLLLLVLALALHVYICLFLLYGWLVSKYWAYPLIL
ncbi:hypothetical protein HYPSUDRAFT_43450, partial [Hypholoma sublateritium FD-334 SS-4]